MPTPLETSFSAQITPWHDFYALTGGAAVSFLGLLFVSLALNPRLLAESSPTGYRVWAGQTVNNLISLIVVSLFCLMPDLEHPMLSLALILLGALNIVRAVQRVSTIRGAKDDKWSLEKMAFRLIFPVAAYGLVIYVGVDMLDGIITSMGHLVVAIFLFIVGAGGAAWEMLVNIGRLQDRDAAVSGQPAPRSLNVPPSVAPRTDQS